MCNFVQSGELNLKLKIIKQHSVTSSSRTKTYLKKNKSKILLLQGKQDFKSADWRKTTPLIHELDWNIKCGTWNKFWRSLVKTHKEEN